MKTDFIKLFIVLYFLFEFSTCADNKNREKNEAVDDASAQLIETGKRSILGNMALKSVQVYVRFLVRKLRPLTDQNARGSIVKMTHGLRNPMKYVIAAFLEHCMQIVDDLLTMVVKSEFMASHTEKNLKTSIIKIITNFLQMLKSATDRNLNTVAHAFAPVLGISMENIIEEGQYPATITKLHRFAGDLLNSLYALMEYFYPTKRKAARSAHTYIPELEAEERQITFHQMPQTIAWRASTEETTPEQGASEIAIHKKTRSERVEAESEKRERSWDYYDSYYQTTNSSQPEPKPQPQPDCINPCGGCSWPNCSPTDFSSYGFSLCFSLSKGRSVVQNVLSAKFLNEEPSWKHLPPFLSELASRFLSHCLRIVQTVLTIALQITSQLGGNRVSIKNDHGIIQVVPKGSGLLLINKFSEILATDNIMDIPRRLLRGLSENLLTLVSKETIDGVYAGLPTGIRLRVRTFTDRFDHYAHMIRGSKFLAQPTLENLKTFAKDSMRWLIDFITFIKNTIKSLKTFDPYLPMIIRGALPGEQLGAMKRRLLYALSAATSMIGSDKINALEVFINKKKLPYGKELFFVSSEIAKFFTEFFSKLRTTTFFSKQHTPKSLVSALHESYEMFAALLTKKIDHYMSLF